MKHLYTIDKSESQKDFTHEQSPHPTICTGPPVIIFKVTRGGGFRIWLATQLIKLAAFVLGAGYEETLTL